jgi:hypothetical protein
MQDPDITPGIGSPPNPAGRRYALARWCRPERRRAGRLPAGTLLWCYFEWADVFRLVQRVVDISLRGAGLLLPVPLRPGQRLRLLLGRRGGPLSVTVAWRVAHCREAGENFVAGGPFEEPLSPAAYRQLLG